MTAKDRMKKMRDMRKASGMIEVRVFVMTNHEADLVRKFADVLTHGAQANPETPDQAGGHTSP